MPALQYCGRVDLDRLPGPPGARTLDEIRDLAKVQSQLFVAFLGASDATFVLETNEEGKNPHSHFFFVCSKSRGSIVTALKRFFSGAGLGPFPVGWYSLKVAQPDLLARYFLYISKGVRGRVDDEVVVLLDSCGRMWSQLHEEFHAAASRPGVAKEDFFASLARKCRETGATSREAVLKSVVYFYIHEGKKGFDSFMVQRTFWRVYSIVNGVAASDALYADAADRLFRV